MKTFLKMSFQELHTAIFSRLIHIPWIELFIAFEFYHSERAIGTSRWPVSEQFWPLYPFCNDGMTVDSYGKEVFNLS